MQETIKVLSLIAKQIERLKSKNSKMTIGEYAEKRSPAAKKPKFIVTHSHSQLEKTETTIKENQGTLNYITPHFRAEAEVEIGPLREGEAYSIGWVQAVTSMTFVNTYPSGQSSWEIQELNSGETVAVSDADGRQYPWYGVTTEWKFIQGPCPAQRVRVYMNDNFSPTVSWAVPVGKAKEQPDTLDRIHRDQSFVVWLMVKNETNNETLALKAYNWRAVINIAVDCSRVVGERAKLLEPKIQEQPIELLDLRVPQTALQSPRANEAQKFVWRTIDSELIFEVSCSPLLAPVLHLQPHATSDSRYSCRYTPY